MKEPNKFHNYETEKITRKASDMAEIVMHDDAYIGGRSENNIKCVVHVDLG